MNGERSAAKAHGRLAAALWVLAAGCAVDPIPQPLCQPGAQSACACLGGGSGVQLCDVTRVLGACMCADASVIDTPSVDASADVRDDREAVEASALDAADVPVAMDVPVAADIPTAMDVPVVADAPDPVDVPAPPDALVSPDVPAPPDMPVPPDVPVSPDVPVAPDAGVDAGGPSAPGSNARAGATPLTLGAAETTVTGTTVGATHDGPAVPCGCTSGPDIWYRFTLTQREVVYLDTAGSSLDTSLLITNAAGSAVPGQSASGNTNAGLCNDDGGCAAGAAGFTGTHNSRTAGVLDAGTWYVAVGGCGAGDFTLHVQHLPTGLGSVFYPNRLLGDGSVSSTLTGVSRTAGTCGGAASGEDVWWFATCGGTQQFFSLCASDGASFSRRNVDRNFDPALYIRSALTNTESFCNDDGGTMGGANCRGTGAGADSSNFGARLNNVTTARGLHALVVDERSGGSGMSYTLRQIIR